jgi:hypothetical protein
MYWVFGINFLGLQHWMLLVNNYRFSVSCSKEYWNFLVNINGSCQKYCIQNYPGIGCEKCRIRKGILTTKAVFSRPHICSRSRICTCGQRPLPIHRISTRIPETHPLTHASWRVLSSSHFSHGPRTLPAPHSLRRAAENSLNLKKKCICWSGILKGENPITFHWEQMGHIIYKWRDGTHHL